MGWCRRVYIRVLRLLASRAGYSLHRKRRFLSRRAVARFSAFVAKHTEKELAASLFETAPLLDHRIYKAQLGPYPKRKRKYSTQKE